MGTSSTQNLRQVVQNFNRTIFPLTELLLNRSPSIVLALNRVAGSLPLVLAKCRNSRSKMAQGSSGLGKPCATRWREYTTAGSALVASLRGTGRDACRRVIEVLAKC